MYAVAGDTYLEQVNSSSWRTQLVNQSQLLYICNRVAYHDLLNATRENGNLTISTDETATAMSESMNTLCKIVVSEVIRLSTFYKWSILVNFAKFNVSQRKFVHKFINNVQGTSKLL